MELDCGVVIQIGTNLCILMRMSKELYTDLLRSIMDVPVVDLIVMGKWTLIS